MRPNGRRREIEAPCDEATYALGTALLKRGCSLTAEVLMTGDLSLAVEGTIDGERQDVAIEVCPNGPEIHDAFTRLMNSATEAMKS